VSRDGVRVALEGKSLKILFRREKEGLNET